MGEERLSGTSPQKAYAEYELRLVRAALRAIKAGRWMPSDEEAFAVLGSSPLLAALETFGSDGLNAFFAAAGTGGVTLVGKAPLILLAEWADEATRSSADFAILFDIAKSDRYIFDLLDDLAAKDLARPGGPNQSLVDWLATRSDRPSAQSGKHTHLRWRDAFLTCLMDDAKTLGFPITHNRELSVDSPAVDTTTATALVSALVAARLGQRVGERLLRDIWEKNSHRILR